MGFVDTLMAGHYSSTALAAVALGSSIWLPLFLASQGILMATTPLVAHLVGANKTVETPKILHQGIFFTLILSALSVIFLNNCAFIFEWLNVDHTLTQLTLEYMAAISWGFPALLFYQLLRSFIEGHGKTSPSMKIAILGLLCNIPLNYVLIFGKLGLPELGSTGCGWATAIVMWIMLLVATAYITLSSHFREERLLKTLYLPSIRELSAFIKLGLPIGISLLIEVSMFSVIALLLADLGEVVIASHQITLSFTGLIFMLPLSISMALTIRVGQHLGAGQQACARYCAKTGLLITLCIAILSSSSMALFTSEIVALYNPTVEIITIASQLILIAAFFQFSDAIQITCSGVLRGYKDTLIPLLLVFISYWVIGLPSGYILAKTSIITEAMGAQGFWIGLLIGLSFGAILLLSRVIKVSRRTA